LDLSTTTWPQRHCVTFRRLRHWLEELHVDRPVVLEVGPGAVSRVLSSFLAGGEGESLSWLANRTRAALRNADSLLRRIPVMPLRSYEPAELLQFLPPGSELIVADISRRVIEAVRRQYPQLESRVLDLHSRPFSRPVDVIVCLCVLVRTAQPRRILCNLYQSLKPGGLLVMDNRSCTQFRAPAMQLEQLDSQIWLKRR